MFSFDFKCCFVSSYNVYASLSSARNEHENWCFCHKFCRTKIMKHWRKSWNLMQKNLLKCWFLAAKPAKLEVRMNLLCIKVVLDNKLKLQYMYLCMLCYCTRVYCTCTQGPGCNSGFQVTGMMNGGKNQNSKKSLGLSTKPPPPQNPGPKY